MRIISVPQPWAAALLFGRVDLLPAPRRLPEPAIMLVHARDRDPRPLARQLEPRLPYEAEPWLTPRRHLVGVAEMVASATGPEVRRVVGRGCLAWAAGKRRMLFAEPVELVGSFAGEEGPEDLDWPTIHEALGRLITPAEARGVATGGPVTPSRDGWTGD
ncbi:MAG: hypothetical protein ACLFVH_13200 [Phycisphaerae bacterium]